MDEFVRQAGRTVREAISSWARTVRLSVLIAVGVSAIWTCYYLRGR